jgi:hypothetical protein
MAQRVTGNLQQACIATAEITPTKIGTVVADYALVKKLLTIPVDGMLTGRGWIHIAEAFDPGSSLTIDLGDGADPDEFTFDAAVDMTAVAITALTTASGAFAAQTYGVVGEVAATFVLAGAIPSIGKAYVFMEYLRPLSASGVG